MGPKITSVCVLVINRDGKVLAVSRRDNHEDFGLPGGKVEEGETPKEAVIRETWEETRVKLKAEDLTPVFSAQGRRYYCESYIAAAYDATELTSGEEGVVMWLDYAEVLGGTFKEYNIKLLTEVIKVVGTFARYVKTEDAP